MRNRSNNKIKVRTDQLLSAVKARRKTIEREHKAQVEKYERAKAGFQERVVAALHAAAKRAEKGHFPEMGYRSLNVPFKGHRPERPCRSLEDIDRLIKTLEMAADETISISADDAAEYLG